MYVIKKLRLNKFKPQPVVSPRRLYELYGLKDPKFVSQQTAENIDAVIPVGSSQTKLLGMATEMAKKALEFKADPQNTDPLPRKQPNEY